MPYKTLEQLLQSTDHIAASPRLEGRIEMIVVRPAVDQRLEIDQGELTHEEGLTGDNWRQRSQAKNRIDPDTQLNLMNSRAIEAIAEDRNRWSLAGDQFYVDLDLSIDNLPPGTQLQLGEAIIAVTEEPHLGCKKFQQRFGADATRFVNSDLGKLLNLRGINARVVEPGKVRKGDPVRKLQH